MMHTGETGWYTVQSSLFYCEEFERCMDLAGDWRLEIGDCRTTVACSREPREPGESRAREEILVLYI